MKKIVFLTVFVLISTLCGAQKVNLDSLLEAKIFNLTYTNMVNHKPVWFNGKKYSVVGLYCLFKNSSHDIIFKKMNSIDNQLMDGYNLFRFSEIYLVPVATAPVIATSFDDVIIVEVSELVRSEKRKIDGKNKMTLFKRDDGKYYYETFDTPYYINVGGVKSPKIYPHSIPQKSIKKSVVSKKTMKVTLINNKVVKIDRTTFLWNNGVTL